MKLNEKLATIQTKFKSKKSRFNSFGKYNFRSAEDILEATKPYLLELGVSVKIDETIISTEPMPIVESKATISDGDNSINATALVGEISASNLTIVQPETAEQAFKISEAGIRSGEFGLIIFDSVGALAPEKVKAGEFADSHVALVARLMGQFIARNAAVLRQNNVAFLFINQVRAKIGRFAFGGFERPGGYALKHETSVEIYLTKAENIKIGDEIQGVLTKFVVKKNKLAPPFRTNYIPLTFGKGIDQGRDVISFAELLGVITKKGSFYSFEGETIGQGMTKASKALEDNPELLDKIREMCYNIVLQPKIAEVEFA